MSKFDSHTISDSIPFLPFITAHDDRKKRPRTAFSAAQIKALETEFERGKYLSVAKRTALAKQLQLIFSLHNVSAFIFLLNPYEFIWNTAPIRPQMIYYQLYVRIFE